MARDQPRVDGNVDPDGSDALAELAASAPRYRFPYDGDIREMKEQQGKHGVMFAGRYKWDNARCTREAYGDSKKHASGRHLTRDDRNRRSLYFHTTWMDTERALECIREVPEYNAFHPAWVADVVESFDHPALWVVGRESSVVLYAWTEHPKPLVDAMQSIRERYAADLDGDREPDIFAPRGPDEIGVTEAATTYPGDIGAAVPPIDVDPVDGPAGVRMWWD